jgi:shikimate kinase
VDTRVTRTVRAEPAEWEEVDDFRHKHGLKSTSAAVSAMLAERKAMLSWWMATATMRQRTVRVAPQPDGKDER